MAVLSEQPQATEKLFDIPTGWLEAFATLISCDRAGNPDVGISQKISAIYRMRAIEECEGRSLSANPDDALAELARRKDPDGSQRRAVEIEALVARQAEIEAKIASGHGALRPLLRRLDAVEERLNALRTPA